MAIAAAASSEPAGDPAREPVEGDAVFRKITLRLIPYMFLLYILAYLDRVNVGYAAVQMRADLHLSDTVYGIGAGVFFIGSALFDIPSNLILAKVGPRRWMARIMISWGIVAGCMSLVHSPMQFYLLRFLLGVAEAGFFPGMILYLTYWFPAEQRARIIGIFMVAIPVSGFIGSPISGALLGMDGLAGLAGVVGGPVAGVLLGFNGLGGLQGWQWLFLAEGVPTAIVGVSVLFVLKDHPSEAKWLTPEEGRWLEAEIERDRKEHGSGEHHNFVDALKLPALYLLAAVYFASQVAVYVINLWLPSILNSVHKAGHLSASATARWSTIPYLITAILMMVVGWSSDRTKDRRFHVTACMLCTAASFAAAVHAHTPAAVLLTFTFATLGVFSLQGPFWTWLTSMLEGTAAAGGIAIIAVVGNVGAFLGQITVGRLSDVSHGYTSGLYTIGGVVLAGAVAAVSLRNPEKRAQGDS